MSVYFIAQINIHNSDEYKKYVAAFRAMFGAYKGEVLVVDENPVVLEGDWPYTRTAIIRFDDEAEAKRWYQSPEYQAAARFRYGSATTRLVLVKGLR